MSSRFLLRCDDLNSQFTLTQEGQDWRQTFESFEDAYENAEARAITRALLIIVNEQGRVMLSTSISPQTAELSIAREHWRKLALAD